ncbi:MAG: hypothetical protein ACJAYB_003259 [Psychromonas sp.]|jgi:hypothetical protein
MIANRYYCQFIENHDQIFALTHTIILSALPKLTKNKIDCNTKATTFK